MYICSKSTIAETAKVHKKAIIVNSNIGEGVIIGEGCLVKNSKILNNSIILESKIWDCFVIDNSIVYNSKIGDKQFNLKSEVKRSVIIGCNIKTRTVIENSFISYLEAGQPSAFMHSKIWGSQKKTQKFYSSVHFTRDQRLFRGNT